MILSFADKFTEKVFEGEKLTKKERQQAGDLNLIKAQRALDALDSSNEAKLIQTTHLHYHHLHGTRRYSIDANGRRSKWRVTFSWVDQHMQNVELVKIEDTH